MVHETQKSLKPEELLKHVLIVIVLKMKQHIHYHNAY